MMEGHQVNPPSTLQHNGKFYVEACAMCYSNVMSFRQNFLSKSQSCGICLNNNKVDNEYLENQILNLLLSKKFNLTNGAASNNCHCNGTATNGNCLASINHLNRSGINRNCNHLNRMYGNTNSCNCHQINFQAQKNMNMGPIPQSCFSQFPPNISTMGYDVRNFNESQNADNCISAADIGKYNGAHNQGQNQNSTTVPGNAERVRNPNDFQNNETVRHPNDFQNNETVRHPNDFQNNQAVRHPNDFQNNQAVRHPNDFQKNQAVRHPNEFQKNQMSVPGAFYGNEMGKSHSTPQQFNTQQNRVPIKIDQNGPVTMSDIEKANQHNLEFLRSGAQLQTQSQTITRKPFKNYEIPFRPTHIDSNDVPRFNTAPHNDDLPTTMSLESSRITRELMSSYHIESSGGRRKIHCIRICTHPDIRVWTEFLTNSECEEFISRFQKHSSNVIGTTRQVCIRLDDTDSFAKKIRHRFSVFMHQTPESTIVKFYLFSYECSENEDKKPVIYDIDRSLLPDENEQKILVFLNDVDEGLKTFTNLGFSVRPKSGSAVLCYFASDEPTDLQYENTPPRFSSQYILICTLKLIEPESVKDPEIAQENIKESETEFYDFQASSQQSPRELAKDNETGANEEVACEEVEHKIEEVFEDNQI